MWGAALLGRVPSPWPPPCRLRAGASVLGRCEGIFHVEVSFLLSGQKAEVRVPSLLLLFFQYLWLKIILEPEWYILG